MTDDHEARDALALAHRMSRPAARAARRWVRRYLLVMGVATGAAVLGSGVISTWGGTGMVWARALATGALWGVLFGAALALVKAEQVRAVPARRQVRVVAAVSTLVIAVTMGIGRDLTAAYPIGATLTFAVWALGALWVSVEPPGVQPPGAGHPTRGADATGDR
jgi:hypothetical protein